jgi:pimeloyl-ACP methyl ester carboxylesterase
VRASQTPAPQTDFTFYSPLAEEWYRSGSYFEWTSTTQNNERRRVNVFYRTFGDRAKPALVILHGYPTSSFDFRDMIPFLEEDYFIAILDFPGFGFSDKPQDGYSYMLEDDAKLVDHFVRNVVELPRFHLLTHDRGGSVGFAFLGNYLARENPAYEITYHFISNGGLFLPLANLNQRQYETQHAVRGPEMIREQQARPRLTEGTPQQVAYADIQAFNDGIGARLYVGKYLLERTANEYRWLDTLRAKPSSDRVDLGTPGHGQPAPHRQPHLVQLPRQASRREQLLAIADGQPLPTTG